MLVRTDVDNTVRWKPGERLHHYFEQRCDELPPDHVAVITDDVTLTFRELDERANQAAHYLLEQGLKHAPDSPGQGLPRRLKMTGKPSGLA